jgi:ADP-ribosylglycohydrolase
MTEQPRTLPTTSGASAEGVVIAAAVGDALGWPQEVRGQIVGGQKSRDAHPPRAQFISWVRTSGHYTSKRVDPVGAGEYSDDTQLLCASARACLRGQDWTRWLTDVELPSWPLYQRGGGGAVLSACNAWAAGHAPWANHDARARKALERYAAAGANGVAMRIAPHVLTEPDLSLTLDRVVQDGVLTHGHPRALVGALVYAAALHAAVRQQSTLDYGSLLDAASEGLLTFDAVQGNLPKEWPDELYERCRHEWQPVIHEVEHLLSRARASLDQGAMSNADKLLEELGGSDPKINGAGTVTAIGAVYLASRFAARPMGGMLQAAFLRRGDTDTRASMTGALLGAVHGTGWLEGLEEVVQDGSYLRGLAEALVGIRPEALTPPPKANPLTLRKRMEATLLELAAASAHDATQGTFPDGRTWLLIGLTTLPDGAGSRATLGLEDGQTVFVDVVAKGAKRSAEEQQLQMGEGPGRALNDRRQHRAEPPPSTEPVAERMGITLPTLDLKRAAAFYAALLGCPVPIVKDAVYVTDWLTLRYSEAGHPAHDPILRFAVDNLTGAAHALGAEVDTGVLRGRDPDGRRVEVRSAASQTR